jgi:hypothetical protein
MTDICTQLGQKRRFLVRLEHSRNPKTFRLISQPNPKIQGLPTHTQAPKVPLKPKTLTQIFQKPKKWSQKNQKFEYLGLVRISRDF